MSFMPYFYLVILAVSSMCWNKYRTQIFDQAPASTLQHSEDDIARLVCAMKSMDGPDPKLTVTSSGDKVRDPLFIATTPTAYYLRNSNRIIEELGQLGYVLSSSCFRISNADSLILVAISHP